MNRPFAHLAPIVLTLAVVGCTSDADDGPPPDGAQGGTASPSEMLATATALDVRNARMPIPGVITAGQPTTNQLETLVGNGVRHAISLRPVGEDGAGWEEAHSEDGDYRFDRLPISGAESLTRENVETFARLLEESGDEPTLLYCASSNRVGALLALKAAWIDGVAAQEALDLGLAAGMTRLEGPVRELLGLSQG